MTRLIDADKITYTPSVPIAVISQIVNAGREEDAKHLFHVSRADIDAQPTIDAEPHWIPCSERMPNDDKDYLVTDGESMAVGYYRTDAKAWDNVNFGWLEHREETCGLKMVIAWMPVPKPYEVKE